MAVAPKQKQTELLRKMVPINTLGDDALSKLMDSVVFETLQKGDYLFKQGDSENYNAYLLSGKVVLQAKSRDVDTISAGSDTARFPLAHQVPRKFSAIARTKSQIVRVDNRLLSELINESGGSDYEVSDFDAEATDDWMSQLLQSKVFQQIPAANIQGVMMQMEEQEVLAGEVIIQQGEEGDYYYLINRGTCSVLHAKAADGESIEVAQLGPGSSFGEEALLSNKPRGSTVVMLSDGVLLRLSKSDFIQYVKKPLGHKVSFETAQEQVEQGALWLDIRPETEFALGHLAGAISLPFDLLRQQVSSLDTEKHYVVYCNDGELSATAAYLLLESGLQIAILDRGVSPLDQYLLVTEANDNVVSLPSAGQGAEWVGSEQIQKLQGKLDIAEARGRDQFEQLKKLKLMLDKTKASLAEEKKGAAGAGEIEARLSAEIVELKESLSKRQSQLENVERQVSEAKEIGDKLAKAEQELKEANLERESLQKQLAGNNQADEILRQQLNNVEKALSGAANDRDRAKDELLSLKEQYATNKQILSETEQEVVALEEKLAHQGESENQRHTAMLDIQKALDAEKLKHAELEEKLQQQIESEKQTQEALTAAKEKVAELESLVAEKEKSSSQQHEALSKESEQLSKVSQQLETLNTEKVQLEATLRATNEKVTELEAQFADQERFTKEQQEALDKENDQLKETLQKLDDATAQKGEIEAELKQASEELAQQKSSHEQMLQELQGELSEVTVASEEVGNLQSQVESLHAELEREREDHKGTVASIDGLERDKALLQDQLEKTESELAGFAKASEQNEAISEELAQLHEELLEKEKLREAAEKNVEQLTGQLSALASGGDEIQILRAELESLTLKLEEADSSNEEIKSGIQVIEAERDALAQELNQLRDELVSAQEQVSTEAADVLKQSLADEQIRAEKAETKAAEMVDEIASLRSELEQVTLSADKTDESEEVAALQAELDLVRSQANADLETLQLQLEEARTQMVDGSANAEKDVEAMSRELEDLRVQLKAKDDGGITENSLLHQEIEELKRTVSEREEKISEFDKSLRRLDEQIEDRNEEVDRHRQAMEAAQVDAEEAEFRAQEAEDARKQVEEALYALQQQVENQRPKDSDASVIDSFTPQLNNAGGGQRMGIIGVVLGAVIAFGVAEGLAIMGGGGELLTGMLSDQSTRQIERPVTASGPAPVSRKVSPPVAVESDAPAPATKKPPIKKQKQAVIAAVAPAQKPAVQAPQIKFLARDKLRSGAKAPEMIYLPGGEFTMGSDRSGLAQEERPAHKVAIKGFAIGRNEVTFAEYKAFADATQRSLPNDLGWGHGDRPVINVNWNDAQAYVEWLSQNTGQNYRLPSEAEWEYAAAAGTDTLYWWGYDLGSNRANCFNCGSRWDARSTAPVGQFKPNAFGLNNTAGNVMEWVEDCYHPDYKGAPTNGGAWVEAGCKERVVRGGAFNKSGDSLRSTKRTPYDDDAKLFVVGFRVARDVE